MEAIIQALKAIAQALLNPFDNRLYTDYVPVTSGITFGTGGTIKARYIKFGKHVKVRVIISLGTGGALTGAPLVSLPFNANADFSWFPCGLARLEDNNGAWWYGFVNINAAAQTAEAITLNSGTAYLQHQSLNATVPFTWTTSDKILMSFDYEAV